MIYCKHCGGKLYEEEVWVDNNGVEMQEIGCYQCPKKLQIKITEWASFKKKLRNALLRANAST